MNHLYQRGNVEARVTMKTAPGDSILMPIKSYFDVQQFLASIGEGRTIVRVGKKQAIYAQGAPCDALFYIRKGRVKVTVASSSGKEATIAVLNPTDFFGEGCLAAQSLRMASTTALSDCELMRIENSTMTDALLREPTLSDRFVAYLVGRNLRYQEDLIDHLFNSSERRLARILLLMARFGKDGNPEKVIPKITHEALARMVGTTRSRVSLFMNKFRKMGFIHYNGELEIHSTLLNVLLQDSPERSE